jgi:Diadenosine tetraphosphate (Ap4A) hydrolase and other HIT family hydrolases
MVGEGEVLLGEPDGFERLWTPHRMAYIDGPERPVAGASRADDCPFCRVPTLEDAEGLVVARGTLAYVVLNRFPYNPGHLLVCPYRHVGDYTGLDHDELVEMAELTQTAARVLREGFGADGVNLGMNLGAVAGAGITGHVHQHAVPRWAGDSNFLPIVARTKALPALLGDTRERLAAAWPDH